MKHYHIQIEAKFRPEVIERILRVVRHRGFRVCEMQMETRPCQKLVQLNLNVSSSRAIELLTLQLEKIFEVTTIALLLPVQQTITA
jgi:acetolactate synthase II small subunit